MKVLFLLNADAGPKNISMDRLMERFEEIDEADCLAGSYDVYVKADVRDEGDLERLHDQIRGIRWVRDIETNIILPDVRYD